MESMEDMEGDGITGLWNYGRVEGCAEGKLELPGQMRAQAGAWVRE